MKINLEFGSHEELMAYCREVVGLKRKKPKSVAGQTPDQSLTAELGQSRWESVVSLLEADSCLAFGGRDGGERLREIGVDGDLLVATKEGHPLSTPATPGRKEMAAKVLEAMAALDVLSEDSHIPTKDVASLCCRSYPTIMTFNRLFVKLGIVESVQGKGTTLLLPPEKILTERTIANLNRILPG